MSKAAVQARKEAAKTERRRGSLTRRAEAQARAGAIWSEAARYVREHAKEGITTAELDERVERLVLTAGGTPTNKGYQHRGEIHEPYPAATCFMPNDMVSHGIPNSRALRDGDILTFDMGVTVEGMHADAAFTFPIGEVSPEIQRFIYTCDLALRAAIIQCVPGNTVGAISRQIESVIDEAGYGIVRVLCGHGINSKYHDDPQIPNHYAGEISKLYLGQALAIEPIITLGSPDVKIGEDGWTIWTVDGSPAAQFEHTVVVDIEPKVLTEFPL